MSLFITVSATASTHLKVHSFSWSSPNFVAVNKNENKKNSDSLLMYHKPCIYVNISIFFIEQGEAGEASRPVRAVLPTSGALPNALCVDRHPSNEHC